MTARPRRRRSGTTDPVLADPKARDKKEVEPNGGTVEGDNISRTPAQRDADRLFYSTAFMRLSGVTQITSPTPANPTIHNRLTHSLKVAQIARSITDRILVRADASQVRLLKKLGGLDPAVAYAAGLCHDLGHPPFGHAAEEYIDRMHQGPDDLDLLDGFEGNAQTFRIATRTEGSHGSHGLNLTAATRAAILKYPWPRPAYERDPRSSSAGARHNDPKPSAPCSKITDRETEFRREKFGYYTTEQDQFARARNWLPEEFRDPAHPCQSLEASAMDVADDITYALHDLEDFIRLGVLDVREIWNDIESFAKSQNSDSPVGKLATELAKKYLLAGDGGIFDEEVFVAQCRALSLTLFVDLGHNAENARITRNQQLTELINSTNLHPNPAGDVGAFIRLDPDAWHKVQILKWIPLHYLISRPEVGFMQAGQCRLIRSSIVLLKEYTHNNPSRLPDALYSARENASEHRATRDRAIVDYICTLGDMEVSMLVAELSGSAKSGGAWSTPHF